MYLTIIITMTSQARADFLQAVVYDAAGNLLNGDENKKSAYG